MTPEQSMLLTELPQLRRYARILVRDAHAEEDLVQSCVERALGRLDLWQRDRPLRPWLFTIMHNLYVDTHRRRVGSPVRFGIEEGVDAACPPTQENDLQAKQVLAATQTLPEDQRQALLLVAMDGLSYKEAADVLGVPIGTLMSRLHRGRERLRVLLGMSRRSESMTEAW